MSNLTKQTKALIKSMNRVIAGWEKDADKLKESQEKETDVNKHVKLGDKIRKLLSEIAENKVIIKAIQDDMNTKQQ